MVQTALIYLEVRFDKFGRTGLGVAVHADKMAQHRGQKQIRAALYRLCAGALPGEQVSRMVLQPPDANVHAYRSL